MPSQPDPPPLPERGRDLERITPADLPLPKHRSITPPSSPSGTLTPAAELRCICGGSGVVLMAVAHARAARLAILDRYGDRALTPCDCTDGRQRASKWRNLPREANGLSLTTFRPLAAQKAAVKQAKAFVADPYGWLTLIGGYGIGKTRIIYACMNDLADRGIVGRYVMMPELLNELRNALRDDDYGERLRRFVEAPLLAVDELDKIRDSDFVDEVLQAIFLARYQQRDDLSTIIGYNADGQERIPPFLRSRISDSRFRRIDMAGPDVRPIAHQLDPYDRGEGEV
jgi:DNA replication protein DnaC